MMLTGPVMALWNQTGTYSVAVWACGHDARGVISVVPLVTLVVTLAAGLLAFRVLSRVPTTNADEVERRPIHFAALCAATICLFSAAVIIAQWIAVFTYPPCMQS